MHHILRIKMNILLCLHLFNLLRGFFAVYVILFTFRIPSPNRGSKGILRYFLFSTSS